MTWSSLGAVDLATKAVGRRLDAGWTVTPDYDRGLVSVATPRGLHFRATATAIVGLAEVGYLGQVVDLLDATERRGLTTGLVEVLVSNRSGKHSIALVYPGTTKEIP